MPGEKSGKEICWHTAHMRGLIERFFGAMAGLSSVLTNGEIQYE
jgi:hypothetical protein